MATEATPARLAVAALRPVDASTLALVRIGFGLVVATTAGRWLAYGWVATQWVEPTLRFTYPGFGWVPLAPAPVLHGLVGLLGAAGLAAALGWRTRATAGTAVVVLAYLDLLDVATYLNHHVLLLALGVLLVVAPSGAAWSLDARRRGERPAPAWALWAVRTLVGSVYLWAGVAKLHPGWLLRGEPLGGWLAANGDLPVVGPLLGRHEVALVAAWAGVAFDLTVVPALLHRRTRPFAHAAAFAFHGATALLFPIGVFPVLMGVATASFLPPGAGRRRARPAPSVRAVRAPTTPTPLPPPGRRARLGLGALAAVLLLVVAFPGRTLLVPGDDRWTDDGFRFAWKVMAVDKAGTAELRVSDPASGRRWLRRTTDDLSPLQASQVPGQPDLVLQWAHRTADRFRAEGFPAVEVRADVFVSMDGGPAWRLVDPDVDLARTPQRWGRKRWVLAPGTGLLADAPRTSSGVR